MVSKEKKVISLSKFRAEKVSLALTAPPPLVGISVANASHANCRPGALGAEGVQVTWRMRTDRQADRRMGS